MYGIAIGKIEMMLQHVGNTLRACEASSIGLLDRSLIIIRVVTLPPIPFSVETLSCCTASFAHERRNLHCYAHIAATGKRGSRFFFPDDFESSPYPLRRYITQALA